MHMHGSHAEDSGEEDKELSRTGILVLEIDEKIQPQ
jgi:hypothetical protein